MTITAESIGELEAVVSRYESVNGDIDLDRLVTTDCQCTGSMCSTGCQGNKGNFWPEPTNRTLAQELCNA
jgi:hypothetical protein